MSANPLPKGIVRILQGGKSGETAGTGFVVQSKDSKLWVVTNAHVLKSHEKDSAILLEIIVSPERWKNNAEGYVEVRGYVQNKYDYEDIAILRLEEPANLDIEVLKLSRNYDLEDLDFCTYGFSERNQKGGLAAEGKIVKKVPVNCQERLQLIGANIDRGFSGAPILDTESYQVIGIINQRSKDGSHTALAIPISVLISFFPDLELECSNPYQGLSAFGQEQSKYFYGRGEFIDELLNQLRKCPRFLIVIGSSGSGKSSVIQAGLFPKLEAENICDELKEPAIILLRPSGENTFTSDHKGILRHLLLVSLINKFPDLKEKIPFISENYWEELCQSLQGKENILIFVDQFEEVFTLYPEDIQQDFINGLLKLKTRVSIIIALRADFYHCFLDSSLYNQPHLDLPSIIPAEEKNIKNLREIIIEPARKEGYHFDELLADIIIQDLEGTQNPLPLLEFTLYQLWDEYYLKNGSILKKDYERTGKVTGAIARWADEAYNNLQNTHQQELARQLFLSLICYNEEVTETRRIRLVSELVIKPRDEMQKVINTFIQHRLLITSNNNSSEEVIEIVHEALLKEWGTLRNWIREYKDKFLLLQRVERDAQEWVKKNKDRDFLLKRARLETAKQLLNDESIRLLGCTQEYIKTSDKQQNWEDIRAWLYQQHYQVLSKLESEEHIVEGLALATWMTIRNREAQLPEGILLEVNDAFLKALNQAKEKNILTDHKGVIHSISFSSDGSSLISGGEDGLVRLWDIQGELKATSPKIHQGSINSIAINADSSCIASGGEDGIIYVWDNQATNLIRKLYPAIFDGTLLENLRTCFSMLAQDMWRASIKISSYFLGVVLYSLFVYLVFINFDSVVSNLLSENDFDQTFINLYQGYSVHIKIVFLIASILYGVRELIKSFQKDWKIISFSSLKITSLRFNPVNSNQLISAYNDGRIVIWNLRKQKVSRFPFFTTTHTSSTVPQARFYADGKSILSTMGFGISYWNLRRFLNIRKEIIEQPSEPSYYLNTDKYRVFALDTSSDSHFLIAASREALYAYEMNLNLTWQVWKESLKENKVYIHPRKNKEAHTFTAIAFNPVPLNDDQYLTPHIKGIVNAYLSENDKVYMIASADTGSTIRLHLLYKLIPPQSDWQFWVLDDEELYVCKSQYSTSITSLTFSPDGKTLASGTADGVIKLWDIRESLSEDPNKLIDFACERLAAHPIIKNPETWDFSTVDVFNAAQGIRQAIQKQPLEKGTIP